MEELGKESISATEYGNMDSTRGQLGSNTFDYKNPMAYLMSNGGPMKLPDNMYMHEERRKLEEGTLAFLESCCPPRQNDHSALEPGKLQMTLLPGEDHQKHEEYKNCQKSGKSKTRRRGEKNERSSRPEMNYFAFNSFKCSVVSCQRRFHTMQQLENHVKLHNYNWMPDYVCPVCNKSYNKMRCLELHMSFHRNRGEYRQEKPRMTDKELAKFFSLEEPGNDTKSKSNADPLEPAQEAAEGTLDYNSVQNEEENGDGDDTSVSSVEASLPNNAYEEQDQRARNPELNPELRPMIAEMVSEFYADLEMEQQMQYRPSVLESVHTTALQQPIPRKEKNHRASSPECIILDSD